MKKLILGVALAGVAASIAVIAQSQMKSDSAVPAPPPAPAPAAGPAVALPAPEPATRNPNPAPGDVPAATPAPAPAQDTKKPYIKMPIIEPNPADEQAATSILKRAANAYRNVRSLKADFVNRRDNPLLGSTSTYRGTLYQKQPDRFLMKFSEPAGDIIVSDGRYFWLYYPSADKRQVLRAPAQTGAAGGVDLQAQFLGDPLTRFGHTYHGKETVGGRATHVLTLVPRAKQGYRSLKVWIDDKDALVRKFILTENNGLVQDFTLSGLVVNPSLSNDLFSFTPPEGAKVIESP